MNTQDFSRYLDITLYAFDRKTCDHRWNYPGINSPFSRLLYLIEGESLVRFDGRTIHMTPGNVVLVPPFVPVDYFCSNRFEHYYAVFTCLTQSGLDFFRLGRMKYEIKADAMTLPLFIKLHEMNPNMGLRKIDPREPDYNALIKETTHEHRQSPEARMATQGALQILLSRFISTFTPHDTGTELGLRFLPVIHHIGTHLHTRVTLRDLAEVAGLHPAYFSDLFERETGLRPIAFLTRKRIERAQLLLHSTQNSVKEIASDCGFSDSNYFFRVFQRHIGITPSQYRRQSASLTEWIFSPLTQ